MCQRLNLAGITSLQSSDLEGLANPDDGNEGPPRLTHLNLNNTSVDDTAAPYLSACVHLQTLELAGTKFSSTSLLFPPSTTAGDSGDLIDAGLFPVIDACERLEKLDLTSCRGVRVGERRRFFEVHSLPGCPVQFCSQDAAGLGKRMEKHLNHPGS